MPKKRKCQSKNNQTKSHVVDISTPRNVSSVDIGGGHSKEVMLACFSDSERYSFKEALINAAEECNKAEAKCNPETPSAALTERKNILKNLENNFNTVLFYSAAFDFVQKFSVGIFANINLNQQKKLGNPRYRGELKEKLKNLRELQELYQLEQLSWTMLKKMYQTERMLLTKIPEILKLRDKYQYYQPAVDEFVSELSNVSRILDHYKRCVSIASKILDMRDVCKNQIEIVGEKYIFCLKSIKKFIFKNIDKNLLLPDSSDELVALWAYFFSSALIKFIELEPIRLNLDYLKLEITFDKALYFAPFKVELPVEFNERLKKLADKLKRIEESTPINDDFFRSYRLLDSEVTAEIIVLKKGIETSKNGERLSWSDLTSAFLKILSEESLSKKLCEILDEELAPFGSTTFDDSWALTNDAHAIQYFHHGMTHAVNLLSKKIHSLFSSPDKKCMAESEISLPLDELTMGDFAALGYLSFYASAFYELNQLKWKVRVAELKKLDAYSIASKEIIEREIMSVKKKTKDFIKTKSVNQKNGDDIIDNIYLTLSNIDNVNELLKKFKSLKKEESIFTQKKDELLGFIQQIKEHLSSCIKEKKDKLEVNASSVDDSDKKMKIFVDNFLPNMKELSHHLHFYVNCLNNPKLKAEMNETSSIQKISSSAGQIRELMRLLHKQLSDSHVTEFSMTTPLSFPEILEKITSNSLVSTEKHESSRAVLQQAIKEWVPAKEKIVGLVTKTADQYDQCNQEAKEWLEKFNNGQDSLFKKANKKSAEAKKSIIDKYLILADKFSNLKELILIRGIKESIGESEILGLYLAHNEGDNYKKELSIAISAMPLPSKAISTLKEKKESVEYTESELNPKVTGRMTKLYQSKHQVVNRVVVDANEQVKEEVSEKFSKWLTDFFEWQGNWTVTEYPALLKLFREVEELRPKLLYRLSDYSTQLKSHQEVLKTKLSETVRLINWFQSLALVQLDDSLREYKDLMNACKAKLDSLLNKIENCFQQFEFLKSQVSVSSETEEGNFRKTLVSSNTFDLSVFYMEAMVAYNKCVDELSDEKDTLSNLLTQLTKLASNRSTIISPVVVLNEALSDTNSAFSQQTLKVNEFEQEVLAKWDHKEKIKFELYSLLQNPSAFQWFVSRIDPWGVVNSEPPMIASLRDREVARPTVTEKITSFVVTPPSFTLFFSQPALIKTSVLSSAEFFRNTPPPSFVSTPGILNFY